MKKYLILLAMLAGLFSACTKDKPLEERIIGEWKTTASATTATTVEINYMFMSNGSFNSNAVVIDNKTGALVGYKQKMSGTYKVDNATITLNYNDAYLLGTSDEYVSEDKLVKRPLVYSTTANCEIKNDGKLLSLSNFSCPPNALCTASSTINYTKK